MLSIVVLTKNEEKNILDCLETILWADQIIVVDDYSEDRTVDVIGKLDCKKIQIYQRKLDGDFASQRNFGLEKAKGEWVLFIDADERISESLRDEINETIIRQKNNPSVNGFNIKRQDILWGKLLKHGETGKISLLRLGKKDQGKWEGNVHEVWSMPKPIGELDNVLLHYPHQTLAEFLSEINFYTNLRASSLYKEGVNIKKRQIVLYPIGKFFINYFVKLGFLDGVQGLIVAIMMSFHSFLVRAKLWSLWRIN